MSATRKRFIAGAVCPSCKAMDTLAVWREDQVEVVPRGRLFYAKKKGRFVLNFGQ